METKTIAEFMDLFQSVGEAGKEKAATYIEGLADGYKTGYAEGLAKAKKKRGAKK